MAAPIGSKLVLVERKKRVLPCMVFERSFAKLYFVAIFPDSV
jgi:hypothetical protein